MKKSKKKILVADDDRSILDAISLMLEDVGYEVKTTVDGHTINMMKQYKPDLLLLDIWMSGIDGRDICKELKANDQTKDIPIIMISANRDTKEIAKEAGANDFIAKPFQMDELIAKINKYTSNK